MSESGGGGGDTDTGMDDTGTEDTGTTDPESTDTGTDEGGWVGCESEDFTVPLVRESVVLVYDKSASMFSTLLEDGEAAVSPRGPRFTPPPPTLSTAIPNPSRISARSCFLARAPQAR